MGSNGQTPITSYYLLKSNPQLKPKMAVIEVYWGGLRHDKAIEDGIDVISNTAPGKHTAGLVWQVQDLSLTLTAAAHTLVQPFYPIENASQMAMLDQQSYGKDGFVSYICPPLSPGFFATDTFSIRHHPIQMEYLGKSIALLRERGCTSVILVRTPVTDELLKCITNYPQEQQEMHVFAQKHGVPFFDFNATELRKRLELTTPSDFCDQNHPNTEGARKITTLWVQLCKEQGYWTFAK